MKRRLAVLLLAAVPLLCAAATLGTDFVPRAPLMPNPLSWNDVAQMPLPPTGDRIAYGSAPQQFGELRVPKGAGPFPVVVLIHGGCWQAQFDYHYMTHLAAVLQQRGIASWTIEYRRLGDAGGGWPGTFLDVAMATDHLRKLAANHPLDLKRVAAAGHSAGGHLALWLAARARLPQDSEVYLADPLPLRSVVGLAPIADLSTYRVGPPDSCNSAVDQLLGGTPTTQPLRYAQTSPAALLPLRVPQWIVQGADDRIVPLAGVQDYVARATAAGDAVELESLRHLGHFDVAVPGTAAEDALFKALAAATAR